MRFQSIDDDLGEQEKEDVSGKTEQAESAREKDFNSVDADQKRERYYQEQPHLATAAVSGRERTRVYQSSQQTGSKFIRLTLRNGCPLT